MKYVHIILSNDLIYLWHIWHTENYNNVNMVKQYFQTVSLSNISTDSVEAKWRPIISNPALLIKGIIYPTCYFLLI